jgi:hypothetical protein
MKIKAVNGTGMQCEGIIALDCKVLTTSKSAEITFLESSDAHEIIISYKYLTRLNALPKNFPYAVCNKIECGSVTEILATLIEEFKDVISDELPSKPMNAPPMSIKLKEGPISHLHLTRARPLAIHQQKKAFTLLQALAKATIIKAVTKPTKWVSPALFVTKSNGELRLVTDYTALNKEEISMTSVTFNSANQRFALVDVPLSTYSHMPVSKLVVRPNWPSFSSSLLC